MPYQIASKFETISLQKKSTNSMESLQFFTKKFNKKLKQIIQFKFIMARKKTAKQQPKKMVYKLPTEFNCPMCD